MVHPKEITEKILKTLRDNENKRISLRTSAHNQGSPRRILTATSAPFEI